MRACGAGTHLRYRVQLRDRVSRRTLRLWHFGTAWVLLWGAELGGRACGAGTHLRYRVQLRDRVSRRTLRLWHFGTAWVLP